MVEILFERAQDDNQKPATRMADKTFEDALGEFSLREMNKPETGTVIGVWIEVEGRKAWFQPIETKVEKLYQAHAQWHPEYPQTHSDARVEFQQLALISRFI